MLVAYHIFTSSHSYGACLQDNKLYCRVCKTIGQASSLMFLHDWQGWLDVICCDCWIKQVRDIDDGASGSLPVGPSVDDEALATEFVRLRKASWRTRSRSETAILRAKKVGTMLKDTTRETDETVRQWKRRAISSVAAVVSKFVQSFRDLSPEDASAVTVAFDIWHSMHEALEKDPTLQIEMNFCGTVRKRWT